jgi:hypothetical protein
LSARLKQICENIIVIDRQIRDLVRSRTVITFADIEHFKRLKRDRRYLVGAIEDTARSQERY